MGIALITNNILTDSGAALTGYVPYTGATADVNLGTFDLTAERGTFTNNGSSDTLTVNHTSGSGISARVTKAGNGEALLVSKTSGSGNAVTITGGLFSAEAAVFSGGITLTGAQTIQTSTGNLTLATDGGNGNILLTPNGTGNVSLIGNSGGATVNDTYPKLWIRDNFSGNFSSDNQILGELGFYSNDATTPPGSMLRSAIRLVNSSVSGNVNSLTFWYNDGVSSTLNEGFRLNRLGNVLIGTTTDAGFRLDVNGTARVQGVLTTTDDAVVYGVSVGRGGGAITTNTRVGANALNANTTGGSNVAIGQSALNINTTGSNISAVGVGALQGNITGSGTCAIGRNAGRYIADGTTNNTITTNSVFIGINSRALADNQENQIVIGNSAIGLGSNTTVIGNSSTSFGRWFGNLLVGTSTNSTFALDVVGTARTTGDISVNGVSVGRGGGAIATNTSVGSGALAANTTGVSNSAFGTNALLSNTTGTQNTAFGRVSMQNNTTGANNTAIGHGSLLNIISSNGNVGVGVQAGRYIADGTTSLTIASNSIFIGESSRAAADNQTNQIVIGYTAIGLGSNTTVLGNSSTTFGRWFGNLLVGSSTNSGQMLQVTGTAKITDTLTIGATDNSFIYESSGSLILQTGASARLTIASSGESTFFSTIKTGSPTGSTAQPFKVGSVTSSPSNSFFGTVLKMEINGVVYDIMIAEPPL